METFSARLLALHERVLNPETGKPWNERRLVECLEQGAERFGWAGRPTEPGAVVDGDWHVGTGVAASTAANASRCGAGVIADGTRTPMRSLPGSAPTLDANDPDGSPGTYGPPGSPPAITSSIAAVSRTVRVTANSTPMPSRGSA